jgi:N-acetylneuraminic acid mutarotase
MSTVAEDVLNVWPDLPNAVSNNAVAAADQGSYQVVFSLLGIGPSKVYNAITNAGYLLRAATGRWDLLPPVPGVGRLAATAQCVAGNVYLIGGYTVNAQAAEHTVPNVDIFSPATGTWARGADIPVPVDDSVSGVYENRYIYLISGWSESDNVDRVQIYDTVTNTWLQATPIAGRPVFGHAGSILGNVIVYCDGVYRSGGSFAASNDCWLGSIQPGDGTRITWSRLPNHPGVARYRIAAGADSTRGKVWFVGGTDNPYNYDGIGYDGRPSEPSPLVFAWDLSAGAWQAYTDSMPASMDHRGLVVAADALVTIGGMDEEQRVISRVRMIGLGDRQGPFNV